MNELEAIFYLHTGLPREAPGSDEVTIDALRRLPALGESPRVFDLGCGPGRSTLVLAQQLQSRIIALDIHGPYLEQLRSSAESQGVGHLIEPRCGRMEDVHEAVASVDLIWCEGAMYLLGFENALKAWRPMLKPGGCLAGTEISWLTENPPAEAAAFWNAGYPQMGTVDENVRRARDAGYDIIDHFTLPDEAWRTEYFEPLQQRMSKLRPEAEGNPALAAVLAETEKEIAIRREFGDSFGYEFYLLQAAAVRTI